MFLLTPTIHQLNPQVASLSAASIDRIARTDPTNRPIRIVMMQPSSPSVLRPLALVAGLLLLLLLVPEGSAFRGGPVTGSHRQQARRQQRQQTVCRMMAQQPQPQQQQPEGQESRLGALKRGALAAQVCKGKGERDVLFCFFVCVCGGGVGGVLHLCIYLHT